MDYVRYIDRSIEMAVELVNVLTPGKSQGQPLVLPSDAGARQTHARRATERGSHQNQPIDGSAADQLYQLAALLRPIFEACTSHDAARRISELIDIYRAAPQLILEEDAAWRLHFHSAYAGIATARGAGCAVALAMLVESGSVHRLGVCEASECDRVYYDTSRNRSRRFCSPACTNRTKAALFRRRKALAGVRE